jgi:2-keto-4-pentenoate hydratase/2-oxohepta-3-ene-1,7-dioic acid hydratase in catechol pathway
MKLCRFQPQIVPSEKVGAAKQPGTSTHPEVLQGVISGETVREVSGDIFGKWEVTSRSWPLASVKLLPPVLPSKIVCVGRNYREHAAEFNNPVPQEPIIFLKPPSSLVAPGDPIVRPSEVKRVDYEGELAVIISRECSQLRDGDDVTPYIAGYTCLNDISARDYQSLDKTWTRAKCFDTFCPMGPVMETEFDLAHGTVETLLNGVRKQYSPLSEMVFPVNVIIPWISRVMTLVPGDVIATGTPANVGPIQAGDVVEVVIPGIGSLSNPVVARSA